MSGVTGGHHVLGVKHLLGQLWDCQGSILLTAPRGERGKAWHEEVQSGEGHHVDGYLTEVGVQLAREPETGGDARHCGRDEVVQVSVGGGGQLQGSEADIIQSLVVDAVCLICVLHKLVDRQGGVVGLYNCVLYLRTGDHRESVHDPVRVFLSDLGDEQCAHTCPGTPS